MKLELEFIGVVVHDPTIFEVLIVSDRYLNKKRFKVLAMELVELQQYILLEMEQK